MSRTLSVVVPVYNSQNILPELAAQLSAELPDVCTEYEVILVNDGSPDNSWEVITQLCTQYPWLVGINLMRNYGQHNALLCGIRQARHEIIITMDDDLQHPPSEIPNLLTELEQGYDVVYGTPLAEKHNFWRVVASRTTKFVLQSTMNTPIAVNVSAFRAFRTSLREAFQSYRAPYVLIDALLTWGTTRFSAVPVRHHPRFEGNSNYTFRKLVRHALNMITGFSILPLRIASILGFGFAIFGVLVFIYVIGRFLIQGSPVPGFPFLASIIAIFSGVQLFALGIIGEYLARMHFRMMDRPSYVIQTEIVGREREFNV